MTNVYTRKNHVPRTTYYRDHGGLVARPPDDEKNPPTPPPGLLYPYTRNGIPSNVYTVWNPPRRASKWQTPEFAFNYRWTNFTCSLKDEHVQRPEEIRHKMPDIKYTDNTIYRNKYKDPKSVPHLNFDMPRTKFGFTPDYIPPKGIVPSYYAYEYPPFKYR